MRSVTKFTLILLGSLLLVAAAGCGASPAADSAAQNTETNSPASAAQSSEPASAAEQGKAEPFLSFTDDADREVTLPSQPQRIVVLSPQLLDLLYAVDGTAIARATSTGGNEPEKAKTIEDVGGMTTVNTEKLLSLKPDLVIGSTSFHRDLVSVLEASDIPFALFSLSTYSDLKERALLFGKLAGTEPKATEALAKLEGQIGELTAKVPSGETPSFIMLNVTPSSITVQRENTVGLEVAEMLQMKNVAVALEASQKSPSTAPFSLEKIVELDPDYVFILIHGAREDGEQKIESDLAGQPAWASLRAVKEKRMAILPSDLLLSNPGFRLNESVEYLAKLVYPDVYGNGN
ncbi:ABC transporter substrate-binding protein [Paenibacillus macerans]|uniref:ABC transporter substrate-binding protein n=1 Tax=Paenibacillus macerans TaxID=44252 RepID=UPI00203D9BAA|nr:ABC transporter substrate-binding protein [Paenibacillus macerans]MCM3701636.1 ABC transporter substrate-binding protein [Paenibacillus macerans]